MENNYLDFMRQTASKAGLRKCPQCGEDDIYLGLAGKCMECNAPLEQRDRPTSFWFALRLMHEYLLNYDELTPMSVKADPLASIDTTCDEVFRTKTLPQQEMLLLIQGLISNIGTIGGKRVGGTVTMDKGKPSIQLLNEARSDGLSRVKTLAAVVCAAQYIVSVPVSNTVSLSSGAGGGSPSRNRPSTSPTSSATSKSGCMPILIVVAGVLTLATVL